MNTPPGRIGPGLPFLSLQPEPNQPDDNRVGSSGSPLKQKNAHFTVIRCASRGSVNDKRGEISHSDKKRENQREIKRSKTRIWLHSCDLGEIRLQEEKTWKRRSEIDSGRVEGEEMDST